MTFALRFRLTALTRGSSFVFGFISEAICRFALSNDSTIRRPVLMYICACVC